MQECEGQIDMAKAILQRLNMKIEIFKFIFIVLFTALGDYMFMDGIDLGSWFKGVFLALGLALGDYSYRMYTKDDIKTSDNEK